jgi:hypothetical protein
MIKRDFRDRAPVSLWAVALLLASTAFALASAALLSTDFVPPW